MKRFPVSPFVLGVVVVACAVYLPQLAWPHARFYAEVLTPPRLLVLGGVAKLVCLAAGAAFGAIAATRMQRTNPARGAWMLLAAWLAAWTAGELTLMTIVFLLHAPITVPSAADVAFLGGYALLLAAQLRFVRVYRASGFPVGTTREHATLAGAALAAIGVLCVIALAPIAKSDEALATRAVNVAYPALDLVSAVPAIVLLRIALAFRPGKVWTIWASVLAGFLLMAMGDFTSSLLWTGTTLLSDPVINLTYLLGYFFSAWGMWKQYELVAR